MPTRRSRFHLQVVTQRIVPRQRVIGELIGMLRAGADSVLLRDENATPDEAGALIAGIAGEGPGLDRRLIVHHRLADPRVEADRWRHIPFSSIDTVGTSGRQGGGAFGVSVHSIDEARTAARTGAAYVTFGHVFETASHPGAQPRGMEALSDVVRGADVPVLAIGGIAVENVDGVLATGCAGIAVISAVFDRHDPAGATRGLRERIDASPHSPMRPFPERSGGAP